MSCGCTVGDCKCEAIVAQMADVVIEEPVKDTTAAAATATATATAAAMTDPSTAPDILGDQIDQAVGILTVYGEKIGSVVLFTNDPKNLTVVQLNDGKPHLTVNLPRDSMYEAKSPIIALNPTWIMLNEVQSTAHEAVSAMTKFTRSMNHYMTIPATIVPPQCATALETAFRRGKFEPGDEIPTVGKVTAHNNNFVECVVQLEDGGKFRCVCRVEPKTAVRILVDAKRKMLEDGFEAILARSAQDVEESVAETCATMVEEVEKKWVRSEAPTTSTVQVLDARHLFHATQQSHSYHHISTPHEEDDHDDYDYDDGVWDDNDEVLDKPSRQPCRRTAPSARVQEE